MTIGNSSAYSKLPRTVTVGDWKEFVQELAREPYISASYIWRGQMLAEWALRSSFDRWISEFGQKSDAELFARRHLQRFRSASRGRRGPNPATLGDDSEAWALAQHNAMKTPLLDWTESPYVALFFAFEKAMSARNGGNRAVWAYFLPTVTKQPDVSNRSGDRRTALMDQGGDDQRLVIPIRPAQDDNLRLLSQAGLFTRVPFGQSFDSWVSEKVSSAANANALVKFVIPDQDRDGCLRSLNRMNINHMSLFPDLYGAGMYCNTALLIKDYSD